MAERVVLLAMEVLGVEVGHWCNHCALPSGIRVLFVTRTGPAMTFRTADGCTDCDGDDITVEPVARTIWNA